MSELKKCPKCGLPYHVRKLNWWAKNAKGKQYSYDAYGHRQKGRRKLILWCRISKGVGQSQEEKKKALLERLERDLSMEHGGKLFYKGKSWSKSKKGIVSLVEDLLSVGKG